MEKVLTLFTIFIVSTSVVMAYKESEVVNKACPRCGVQLRVKHSTIDKRRARRVPEHELWLCQDCRPYKLRAGKMTGAEVWEAYRKDMGL